jgi:tetratricopeptide (TPR) repeat protein
LQIFPLDIDVKPVSLELTLRNVFTLLIFLLFGITVVFFINGGFVEIPMDWLEHRTHDVGKGMELNTRGVEELSVGQNERAVSTLREAAHLQPDDPVIKRNLSIALARSALQEGRAEGEALEMLMEALDLWPRNPEGLDGMTTIHFRNARYDEALQFAQQLQIVLPNRPDLDAYITDLKQRAANVKGMVSERGDRFRLLYSGNKRLEYEGEITAILQVHMDALTAALGIFPEDPVDVLILTDDLGERADPLNPYMEGLYDGQIRLYIGDDIEDMDKFILTVRHEMIHALLHEAAGTLPGWVHEGLAQKVGEDPSQERIDMARRYVVEAVSRGYVVEMGALDMTFVDMETEQRSMAYATSLLFMDWLVRNYGESFIPRFVLEISSGNSSYKAVEKLTGSDFSHIQELFSTDLKEGA